MSEEENLRGLPIVWITALMKVRADFPRGARRGAAAQWKNPVPPTTMVGSGRKLLSRTESTINLPNW